MKKEILIAILIGFILGLIITFGVWTANKSLKDNQDEQSPKKTGGVSVLTPEETEELKKQISLEITEPINNSISEEEEITIKGTTSPFAVVTVIYQESEKIIEADGQGSFETEISLVGGTNEIKISAFNQADNTMSKILNVIYSTAEF